MSIETKFGHINLGTVEVLLFDLGGVIVPWVGIEALETHTGQSRSDILNVFSKREIFKQYEIGACNDDVFIDELNHIFSLNKSRIELKTLWKSWVKPPFPETETALQSLRANYVTACLSNTNTLHWEHLHRIMDMSASFDIMIASQIIKIAKPDRACYYKAVEILGVKPDTILFFDDTKINVEMAQKSGMQALHIDRAQGVVPTLKALNLI